MNEAALLEHARVGILEAVAKYTILIDVSYASSNYPSWGTGTLFKIKDKLFIGTCKHVVEPDYRTEDIRVIYKSDVPMKWTKKDEIKKYPLNEVLKKVSITTAQKISIINRFYSDDIDDLALLEIDPSLKNVKGFQFFTLTDSSVKSADIDMQVYLMGFSVELARQVTREGYGTFPYFEESKVVDANDNLQNFDMQRHFLTDFEATEDSADPHGLSGCAVWTRLPSGKNNLWTPNLRLVGVQHGYYNKRRVLVATRVERLLRLII